jgi:tetratricopeptide (TPR) repeat protein
VSLRDLLRGRSNDYAPLDRSYREAVGESLAGDPLAPPRTDAPEIACTVGVLIAVRDDAPALAATLAALERSSLASSRPAEHLRVVVADDGSTDGLRERLAGWRPPFRFTCVRQERAGRVAALNTGLAFLEAGVVVVCEPGVLPGPHALEELARRHQTLDPLLLLGFGGGFAGDRRFGWAGAGDNLFVHTRHLRDFGEGRSLLSVEDGMAILPSLAGGGIYSLRRADLIATGGFDESLRSTADAALVAAARSLSRGLFAVPVYTAVCGSAAPAGKPGPAPWALSLFGASALLDAEPATEGELDVARCRRRASEVIEGGGAAAAPPLPVAAHASPLERAGLLLALGRYAEACDLFGALEGERAALGRARALREMGDPAASLALLDGLREPAAAVHFERGLSRARAGDFSKAGESFTAAREAAADPLVARILSLPSERHRLRGEHHLRQGLDALALRDLELGLAADPGRVPARLARARVLRHGGRPDLAVADLRGLAADTWVHLELGSAYAGMGDRNQAKLHLERSFRLSPGNLDAERHLAALHEPGEELQGTLDPEPLLAASAGVEGWFSREETLLLIAIAEKAAPLQGAFVEIGNYCGRSTVAFAGALRALGQPPGRLVAIDPHEGFAAGKHRDTLPILAGNLRREGLEPWVRVIKGRSEDVPWEGPIAMIFVDGDHEYEGVAADYRRYQGHIIPGGYLLFHDYSRFEPGVRRLVDEVLAAGPYTFLAQAGSLCVLRKRQVP